jgi:Cu/Ag efflux protein CusF
MRYSSVTRRPVAVFVLAVFFVPSAALAGPAPAPAPSATVAVASDARIGGVIFGKVTNVDYQSGVVTVDSTTHGKVDVSTMPTTSVQSDDPGYHTLSDVSRGSKVQIFISRTAGKLVAQIIRLLKH